MIKLIRQKEYDLVCEWWKRNGFPVVPATSLPSTAYMACHNDIPVWAAFLYLIREGTFAWIEFIVSNPDADKSIKQESLQELIDYIENIAKENGAGILFTSADRSKEKYIERLIGTGFFDTKENIAHLLKIITKDSLCHYAEPQQQQQLAQ